MPPAAEDGMARLRDEHFSACAILPRHQLRHIVREERVREGDAG